MNVYRFSELAGTKNRFVCTASKIVDGREIVMGTGDWSYDSAKHLLETVTPHPTIRLTLTHSSDHSATLDGVLLLGDGTAYRRIHLKRAN